MLKITKYNVPSIMPDNDMKVFNLLFKVIEKVQPDAVISIYSALSTYNIIVKVDNYEPLKGRSIMLDELKELSKILGDIFEFPKTLDYTSNIYIHIKKAG